MNEIGILHKAACQKPKLFTAVALCLGF